MNFKQIRYAKVEICLFILSLTLFTLGQFSQEIISFDTRFYLFAKEMLQHGLSWFPTTYGEPYPDYPVTSTLLIYLSAKCVGGLNKLTAVLPSAMAAAGTVVLTYRIGALHDRRWGLLAVSLMLMTVMFIKSARAISLDMYTALFTAWCFYLVEKAQRQKKLVSHWVYGLLALSFAFRGPIGLVMPAGVICSYYLLDGEWKKLIIFGLKALFLLLGSTAVLLGLAYQAGSDVFLQDVIRMQFAGRIDNPYQPGYFYFTNSLSNYALSYPLALITVAFIIVRKFFKFKWQVEYSFLLKLIGWAFIIMVGMSLPGDKKARYVLPMVPAIALLAAYLIQQQASSLKSAYYCLFAALLLNVIYITAIEPSLLMNEKTRDFVLALEDERAALHVPLVFYQEHADGLPIKYQVYNKLGDRPIFIKDDKKLVALTAGYIITSEENYQQLLMRTRDHFRLLKQGRIGHVKVVVLTPSHPF